MNTMTTFTGKHFDPIRITPDDICLEDIAHALSLSCRGGGHLKYFYSVAQHSLNCAAEARARGWSERLQLACLLHDASEAYLSDVIRPIKGRLINYLEIEAAVMEKILDKFGLSGLTEEENKKWKQIDDEILYYELIRLLPDGQDLPAPRLSAQPDIAERDWRKVKAEFMAAACALAAG